MKWLERSEVGTVWNKERNMRHWSEVYQQRTECGQNVESGVIFMGAKAKEKTVTKSVKGLRLHLCHRLDRGSSHRIILIAMQQCK